MIVVFTPVYFQASLAAPKLCICAWIYVLKRFQRMQPILNDAKSGLFVLEQSKNFSSRDLTIVFDVCHKLCHQSVVLYCAVQNCTHTWPMCMKTLPTTKLQVFIDNAHNESTMHPHIHSLSQVILTLPSMVWVLLFRCLLPACLPTDCLPTVWFVCLTDCLHDWLSTVHLFALCSICLSSYQFTDRLVNWMTDH